METHHFGVRTDVKLLGAWWSLPKFQHISSTLNIFTATILQGRQASNQCFEAAKEHVSGFRGQWHSAFLEVAPSSLWDSFPAYSKKSDSITPFSCENILQSDQSSPRFPRQPKKPGAPWFTEEFDISDHNSRTTFQEKSKRNTCWIRSYGGLKIFIR